MNLFGVQIDIDALSHVKTINGWGTNSYLLLTWEDSRQNISNQQITDQTQAVVALVQAASGSTAMRLISASVENPAQ